MISDREHEGIVQWNCNGIRKKEEIFAIIKKMQPLVLALQETMLKEVYFRIPRYYAISKTGHFNWRSHGGTMLLIHESANDRDQTSYRGTSSYSYNKH